MARAYVNDELREEQEHIDEYGQPGELEWDLESERVALGDEFGPLEDDRRLWHGILYEAAIFDRALSASEIDDWLRYH
jgi:hypothetical protein